MKTTPKHLRAGGTLASMKSVVALAPLAVLSAAWTVTLVSPSLPVVAVVGPAPTVSVPDEVLDAPASSTRPAQARRGGAMVRSVVARPASAADIPGVAL